MPMHACVSAYTRTGMALQVRHSTHCLRQRIALMSHYTAAYCSHVALQVRHNTAPCPPRMFVYVISFCVQDDKQWTFVCVCVCVCVHSQDAREASERESRSAQEQLKQLRTAMQGSKVCGMGT